MLQKPGSCGQNKHVEIVERGFELKDLIARRQKGQVTAYVNFDEINRLLQPRRTFDGLEETAASLVKVGFVQTITVALFTKSDMLAHLQTKKIDHPEEKLKTLKKFRIGNSFFYLVLIDGERRYRAAELVYKKGAQYFQDEYGIEDPFWKFDDRMIKCSLCVRTTSEDFLDKQIIANTSVQVPIDEEAEFIAGLFEDKRVLKPKLTIKAFAAEIGKSVSAVSGYLKYMILPEIAKRMVRERKIAYGVSLELVRLWEFLLDRYPEKECQAEITRWVVQAVIGQWKVDHAKMRIKDHLENLKGQQLDLVMEVDGKPIKKRHHDQLVRKARPPAMAALHYLQTLVPLFAEGIIPRSDTPLSDAEFAASLMAAVQKMMPHYAIIATANGSDPEKVRVGLEHTRALIAASLGPKRKINKRGGGADGNG